MTMSDTVPVYTPSKNIIHRVNRRVVKHVAQKRLNIRLEKPIVSFSFDDCPQSVFQNAFPLMEAKGWRGTIYAAMGLCGTTNHLGLHMSEAEMKAASEKGHEIGDHSYSHMDSNAATTVEFLDDIHKNQAVFEKLGLPQARSFAYPFGEVSLPVKKRLSKSFDLCRGIHTPTDAQSLDLNQAASQRLYSGEAFVACREAISQLKTHPSWLIVFTHDVRDAPSAYGCTPDEFRQILDDVDNINADVMPVIEALDKIKADHS